MKQFMFCLFVFAVFAGCKNESKSESSPAKEKINELVTLTGDFIYYADAAVLQTNSEIYGVVIDEKMHELDSTVKLYKKDVTDMVSVTVKAKKFEKPANEEGWPFRIEIKEILKVVKPDPNKNDVIKIGQ